MTLLFVVRAAQKQLKTLKENLKKSNDTEKLMPKITEQARRLRNATQDEKDIVGRIEDREKERLKAVKSLDENARQDNETQRDYLVRTGKITPFSHMPEATHQTKHYNTEATANPVFPGSSHGDIMSHKNLHAPVHTAVDATLSRKRKLESDSDDGLYTNDDDGNVGSNDEDVEYLDDEEDITALDLDDEDGMFVNKKKKEIRKLDEMYDDDGSEANYQKRLDDWIRNRKIMRSQVTHVIHLYNF